MSSDVIPLRPKSGSEDYGYLNSNPEIVGYFEALSLAWNSNDADKMAEATDWLMALVDTILQKSWQLHEELEEMKVRMKSGDAGE